MNQPLRIFEPNIIHNPLRWMGIWTPHGWRVHQKRFGRAERATVTLCGDGRTTFFPNALIDPTIGRVAWRDDLHLEDDPFTDGGIYPSDPRVEYPPGQPRWAVSHTLLCYPFADHGLHTHEYVWDMAHGHLQTHFRQHVACELARTDATTGKTVRVQHAPLSTTIEANLRFPNPTSAVRGVWSNPEKTGTNFYATRVIQRTSMLNGVYVSMSHNPIVQCRGLYEVLPGDQVDGLFEPETGFCRDSQRLMESLLIPIDEPKIALLDMYPFRSVQSRVYEGPISMLSRHYGEVSEAHVDEARKRCGCRFEIGRAGYASQNARDSDTAGYIGYAPRFDLDGDGQVTDHDIDRLAAHIGRKVRLNLYHNAYFGSDWLSTSVCLQPDHEPGTPIIADYVAGGGYEPFSGTIQLQTTPGPDQPVWVEYFYDAPAERGENNIVVHFYREKT